MDALQWVEIDKSWIPIGMELPKIWNMRPSWSAEKNWEITGNGVYQHMTLAPEAKLELILASFRGEVSIADLCRRAQVPESTFRDWRDRFIAAGTAALHQNRPKAHPDWTALTQENGRLKTVVADLSVENLVLKKGRNGILSPAII